MFGFLKILSYNFYIETTEVLMYQAMCRGRQEVIKIFSVGAYDYQAVMERRLNLTIAFWYNSALEWQLHEYVAHSNEVLLTTKSTYPVATKAYQPGKYGYSQPQTDESHQRTCA